MFLLDKTRAPYDARDLTKGAGMARAVVWVLMLVAWLAGTSAMAQPVEGTPIWRYPFAPGQNEYDLLYLAEPLLDGRILALGETAEDQAVLFRIGNDGKVDATTPFHCLPSERSRVLPQADGSVIFADDWSKIFRISSTFGIVQAPDLAERPLLLKGGAIAVSRDGGLVVGGADVGLDNRSHAAVVVKFDFSGVVSWRWRDPNPDWDFETRQIALLRDGRMIVYVTSGYEHGWPGSLQPWRDPQGRHWLVQLSEEGEELARIGLRREWNAVALAPRSDGHVIAVYRHEDNIGIITVVEYDGLAEVARASYDLTLLWPELPDMPHVRTDDPTEWHLARLLPNFGKFHVQARGDDVLISLSFPGAQVYPGAVRQSRQSWLARVDAHGMSEVLTPRPIRGFRPRLDEDGNHIVAIDGPAVVRFHAPAR